MFAKFWEPGKVKTRLAATIGDDLAAAFHREFLLALATELKDSSGDGETNFPSWLMFAPAEARNDFEETPELTDWQCRPQSQGGLGERLSTFFIDAFESGAQRVIAIGSDSPWLTHHDVQIAFEKLLLHDSVIGPAIDGGYYLIGFRRAAFDETIKSSYQNGESSFLSGWNEIRWSHEETLHDTERVIAANGLGHFCLPVGTDVDNFDDLRTLEQLLSRSDQDCNNRHHGVILQMIADASQTNN